MRGKLIVVGGGTEPIPVDPVQLFLAGQSVHGSLTGTALDNQDTFDFSVLQNVRPMIETVPLAEAAHAYTRMLEGKARFRLVLTTT